MPSLSTVMTSDPAVCTPQTPLRDVARMMSRNDCGEIPVVESEQSRKPVGVVTDRDITIRVVAEGRDITSAVASDAMTSPVTTVRQDADFDEVCDLMEKEQIRRIVVVDNRGDVCGIVAQADIARTGREDETADLVREVSEPNHPRH
ncbi:MAG: CBS domain-containing protein [Pseudomonadota bacterium]|nr:CBS domain-containing protein [Pseudomonadota bacterium]